MKRFTAVVFDEEGQVYFHGQMVEFDMNRDYHRHESFYDRNFYVTGPMYARLNLMNVQVGLPNHPKHPHNWLPVNGLLLECKDCGHKETLVASMVKGSPDPCPGKSQSYSLKGLMKALNAGGFNAVPTQLHQGSCHPGCPCDVLPPAVPRTADLCECGATKSSGAKRGDPAHSTWCPWSKP